MKSIENHDKKQFFLSIWGGSGTTKKHQIRCKSQYKQLWTTLSIHLGTAPAPPKHIKSIVNHSIHSTVYPSGGCSGTTRTHQIYCESQFIRCASSAARTSKVIWLATLQLTSKCGSGGCKKYDYSWDILTFLSDFGSTNEGYRSTLSGHRSIF